jgi:hypothetical protein
MLAQVKQLNNRVKKVEQAAESVLQIGKLILVQDERQQKILRVLGRVEEKVDTLFAAVGNGRGEGASGG